MESRCSEILPRVLALSVVARKFNQSRDKGMSYPFRAIRCGAKNRRGEPCAVRREPGKLRCRFHGGLSTGPRTAAGKARIAEAQRRRWAVYRIWQLELS